MTKELELLVTRAYSLNCDLALALDGNFPYYRVITKNGVMNFMDLSSVSVFLNQVKG